MSRLLSSRLELEGQKSTARFASSLQQQRADASSSWQYQQKLLAPSFRAISTRYFSSNADNVLGYSPMAPSAKTSGSSSTAGVPTLQDVSMVGGVWAPTSAKRDKLAELKIAMREVDQESLDEAATEAEKLDLYLADGISCIARTADSVTVQTAEAAPLKGMEDWLTEHTTKLNKLPDDLHQVQWEEHLRNVVLQVDSVLSTLPADRYLWKVRDFYDISGEKDESDAAAISDLKQDGKVSDTFQQSVVRFRLLLTKAMAENMMNSWKTLTAVSDQDVDRAAVLGETLEPRSTLSMEQLHQVLQGYLTGTCQDRVVAVWNLLDHDHDSLLDEVEMNNVCRTVIQPVQTALSTLMQETLDAYPVRAPLPALDATGADEVPRPGWRQRRREAKAKKKLLKMFQQTLKKHFEDEVEMPHRLRCTYAWAEKAHQDNKISSIQVEEAGWSGRQRHVELNPKISLSEFREVQELHFTHLDRIGAEYLKSFREDLWVSQGKRRQNNELLRDCGIFLSVVCVVDYIIIAL